MHYSVSVEQWLSAMWGLQDVTRTADFMPWISHAVVTEESLFLDRAASCCETARHLYLVVQHQQQSAAHAHISRPLHLEAVRLLGGGRTVPLEEQMQNTTLLLHNSNEGYSNWMVI